MGKLSVRTGTSNQYQALSPKDPDTLYVMTDKDEIYFLNQKKGEVNVLEGVQIDGSDVTISNKKVNLTTTSATSPSTTSLATKGYVDSAVNNPTITITQGGTTKGSFTLNQATGDTIALDAGGGGTYTSGNNIDINTSNQISALGYTYNSSIESIKTGVSTEASGSYSHAEGYGTKAQGFASHAEGSASIGVGRHSHAEGWDTEAEGKSSHAEGHNTKALGEDSHAEGKGKMSKSSFYLTGSGLNYTSQGTTGLTVGIGLSSDGGDNISYVTSVSGTSITVDTTLGELHGATVLKTGGFAKGASSHSEGNNCVAYGDNSHAEGSETVACGAQSHAEGYATIANADYSHAEGYNATSTGSYSHAEGRNTTSTGSYSHAEGYNTTSTGSYSHAEGRDTTATGQHSHAEGRNTTAVGSCAHAEGFYTSTSADYQHVMGRYNVDDSNAMFIIGNGTSTTAKKNIFTVSTAGAVTAQGDVSATVNSVTHKLSEKVGVIYEDVTTEVATATVNLTANPNIVYKTLSGTDIYRLTLTAADGLDPKDVHCYIHISVNSSMNCSITIPDGFHLADGASQLQKNKVYVLKILNGIISVDSYHSRPTVDPWYLLGLNRGWTAGTSTKMSLASDGTYYTYVTLDGSTTYQEGNGFKVKYGDNEWYGISGTTPMTYDSCTGWTLSTSGSNNVSVTTTSSGSYKFTWNPSTHQISITYP